MQYDYVVYRILLWYGSNYRWYIYRILLVMLSYQYLLFEQWRENGGLPAQRPHKLRRDIPAQWWVIYKSRHLQKPVIYEYNGFYAQHRGALFRTPGGNIEHGEEQRQVIGWSALDLHATASWSTQIQMNQKYGIVSMPWMQCYELNDIDRIFLKAPGMNQWGHCNVNVENEILTGMPLPQIRQRIDNYKKTYKDAEVSFTGLPWLQNGQGWKALKGIPVFVEIFTNELPQYTAAVCVEHARKEGCNIVGCMWGAYPVKGVFPVPQSYPLNTYKIQSIFTGDDVHNWSDWK